MKKFLNNSPNPTYQRCLDSLVIFFEKNELTIKEVEVILEDIRFDLFNRICSTTKTNRKVSKDNIKNNTILKYSLYDEHEELKVNTNYIPEIFENNVSLKQYEEILMQIEDLLYAEGFTIKDCGPFLDDVFDKVLDTPC